MNVKIFDTYPDEARTVREKVFVEEQGFSYDYDEIDDIATHIVIFDKNIPIAACRVFQKETPETYMMGRIAVKKEYRMMGMGRKIVEAAKEYVAGVGGKIIILHAQMQAKGFYEKQGFVPYGEVEYEEGCPHTWMKIVIEKTE